MAGLGVLADLPVTLWQAGLLAHTE